MRIFLYIRLLASDTENQESLSRWEPLPYDADAAR